MYCASTTLVKYDGNERHATALRCRSWLCPDCQPVRRRQLTAEALTGSPTVFLTLTSRRSNERTADQAAKDLILAWRQIRRRLMQSRKLSRLPFMAIVEATQNGWPHLHILLRNIWISQKWLSDEMESRTGSPIVDIRKIDDRGRAAGYVSKYAGKAAHKFGTAKRYWRSKDWILLPTRTKPNKGLPGSKGEIELKPIGHIAAIWQAIGWPVHWHSPWKATCTIRDG